MLQFLLEQTPNIILTVFGFSFVRSLIRTRWPKIKEGYLDGFLVLILVIGFVIGWVIQNQESKKDAQQQQIIDAMRYYLRVAELNTKGLTGSVGFGLKESSPLSKALEGTWIESDGMITFSCEESSLEKLRHVEVSVPRFPFSYYGLAVCLRKRGDANWRKYAEKAAQILEITTSLESHHPSHDKILQQIRDALNTSK